MEGYTNDKSDYKLDYAVKIFANDQSSKNPLKYDSTPETHTPVSGDLANFTHQNYQIQSQTID